MDVALGADVVDHGDVGVVEGGGGASFLLCGRRSRREARQRPVSFLLTGAFDRFVYGTRYSTPTHASLLTDCPASFSAKTR